MLLNYSGKKKTNKNNASIIYSHSKFNHYLMLFFYYVFSIKEYTLKTYFFATVLSGKGVACLNCANQTAFIASCVAYLTQIPFDT